MRFRKSKHSKYSRKKLFTSEMTYLLELADTISSEDPNLSNRYVYLANKISKKTKIVIPRDYSFKYCKKCNTWWIPSKTVQVRIHSTHITYTCLNCKLIRKKWLTKNTSSINQISI